jgi:SAM-dependent methyltransferase
MDSQPLAQSRTIQFMSSPAYLEPYVRASRRFGAGFGSLLWASPKTQAARFRALLKCCSFDARSILDAGCGRGDFLDFLLTREIRPKRYIGVEAMEPLAAAAEKKRHSICSIARGDFVENPSLLDQSADVIVFCGSLNTLSVFDFHLILTSAWKMAGEYLVFNFLSSDELAKAEHLTWHAKEEVERFARGMTDMVMVVDDYIDGDCTIGMLRPLPHR